jgi:tetratricopeptide (TPR) repeat protein
MLALLFASQLIVQMDDARAERLKVWVAAVERHLPGEIDDAVQDVRRMRRAELVDVLQDVRAVSKLMREPKATVFYRGGQPNLPSRGGSLPPMVVYSDEFSAVLRDVATAARRWSVANELLKRAAILHTDIALLAPSDVEPMPLRAGAELLRATLHTDDGTAVMFVATVDHWEMARQLLARVGRRDDVDEPEPTKDADVLRWYRTSLAAMQIEERLIQAHYAEALRLFPEDPDILFRTGAYRETLAARHVNDVLRRGPNLAGSERDVGNPGDELDRARDLYRRALARAPTHTEARLRLGWVLCQRGAHADAARELRRALSDTKDSLLVYFGSLFLGRVLETQRNVAGAREQYERAAALYPRAQAPRLALSLLASRAGNQRSALAAFDAAFDERSTSQLDDPLWTYYAQAGRDADVRLEETRRVLAPRRGAR